jgi:small subunit ribosomal protein S2
MNTDEKSGQKGTFITALFNVGAHLGYSRGRRHASMKNFIFGSKGKTDIIDLTKVDELMRTTLAFVRAEGAQNKTLLFVGGKPEVRDLVRQTAEELDMPYVAGRWLGGTLTNFQEIKKRIKRLLELTQDRDAGTLVQKYTKKERILIDREIADLEEKFSGISTLERVPDALVVVDTRAEHIAVREANTLKIPVIGIMNSDCDATLVSHPLIGNDSARQSVQFFLDRVVEAYREGARGIVASDTQ